MLSRNFNAIKVFRARAVDFVGVDEYAQLFSTIWFSDMWEIDSGFRDLLATTYVDKNIVLNDTRMQAEYVAMQRGKLSILIRVANDTLPPIPDLSSASYVLPTPGLCCGVVYYIYDHKYKKFTDIKSDTKLENSNIKRITTGPNSGVPQLPPSMSQSYSPKFIQSLKQMYPRVFDLGYILQRKGIQVPDSPLIDMLTGEIFLLPISLSIDIEIPMVIQRYEGIVRAFFKNFIPGDVDYKRNFELAKTLCHYELPEAPELPKPKVDSVLRYFGSDSDYNNSTDPVMCLLSMGKLDLLYGTLILYSFVGVVNTKIDIHTMFITCASNALPFVRDSIIEQEEVKFKTYQQDYNQKLYNKFGTREKTKLIAFDEQDFELLYEGDYKEINRNRLYKNQGIIYYSRIYRPTVDRILVEGKYELWEAGPPTYAPYSRSFTRELLTIVETPTPISKPHIQINGIQFDSKELSTFYATGFYDLVEVQARETYQINVPYFRVADLNLIRDFLKGRIMIQVLYEGLSQSAFDLLSGEATLLELSEVREMRNIINAGFCFGVKFIDSIRDMRNLLMHEAIEMDRIGVEFPMPLLDSVLAMIYKINHE